jgi:DNA topoisomerase-1
VIGSCPDCGATEGGELAIKRVRSGSRLVGCTRYPDCDYSLPLPRRGDIEVTDATCDEHDLPELVVHSGDEPWELGCPICNFRAYRAEQEAKANRLQSVKGIGEKTAKKLEDAGISTVDELREADPDAVAGSVEGVSASQVRSWKSNAEA